MLRKYKEFSPVYDGSLRHLTIAAARGSGKTFAAIDSTVMFLLQGKANSSAAFFSKTLKQAKASTFPVMKEILSHFPKKFWRYNATEGIYTFRISANDERKLYLLSYDTPDNARSYHPCIIVTDECADMPYDMFGNVIYPMLNPAIADGWWRLTNIGTFRGDTNRFYELYLQGQDAAYPDWHTHIVKASECSRFTPEMLENIKSTLTAAEYAQEYECDPHANVILGSVFGEFFRKYAQSRVEDSYAWIPELPVYTAWDIGFSDYTAIWFFQVKNNVVNFIDYEEGSEQLVGYYADILLKKPYHYGQAILPFDGASNNIRGLPIITQLSSFGFRTTSIPPVAKHVQVDSARTLLQSCSFHESNTKKGRERLVNWCYKMDRKTGIKLPIFNHDENSHGAEAFCYAAISKHVWQAGKFVDLNYSNGPQVNNFAYNGYADSYSPFGG